MQTSDSDVGQQAVGRTLLLLVWSLMEGVSSQLGVCIFNVAWLLLPHKDVQRNKVIIISIM